MWVTRQLQLDSAHILPSLPFSLSRLDPCSNLFTLSEYIIVGTKAQRSEHMYIKQAAIAFQLVLHWHTSIIRYSTSKAVHALHIAYQADLSIYILYLLRKETKVMAGQGERGRSHADRKKSRDRTSMYIVLRKQITGDKATPSLAIDIR